MGTKKKDRKKTAATNKKAVKAAAKKSKRGDLATPPAAAVTRAVGLEVAGVAEFPEPDQQGRPIGWQTVAWNAGGFEVAPGSTAITIPPGHGGRYQVSIAVRWVRINGGPFTLEQAKKGYLRCLVVVDGSDHEAVNALQSALSPARGASGSTQHMTWELALEEGAAVGLRVAQSVGPELQADAAMLLRLL